MKKQLIKFLILIALLNAWIELNKKIDLRGIFDSRKVIIINEVARAKEVVMTEPAKTDDNNDNLVNEMTAEFTAYNAMESQTDSSPDIMASGKKVYHGAVACPSKFKFGDKIQIEGLGTFTCEDRMNQRYRDKENFDIFLDSYEEATKFGRKQLKYKYD